jgi:hypothetical protein
MESDPKIEFSRIVSFDEVGALGATYHIEAKEEECRLLAERFQLVSIRQFSADFVLSLGEAPGWYRLEGEVSGDVIQLCVSTLKDVPAHVRVTVHMLLCPAAEEKSEEEFTIDLDDERDIEYYTEEFVDLGETAAQYLYINLDPFPHAPDAPDFPEPTTKEATNPLAQALKGLKKK